MVISATYPNLFRRLIRFFADLAKSEDTLLHRRYDAAVREHTALIDRICFGYARTRADMDDLRQDVLLNLWESMPAFKEHCSMKTWVYRISLNTCVSSLRKNYRKPATVELTDLYDTIDEDNRQLLSELHEAISELNPIDKAIITLWLEEESYEEIASIVGVTKSNVAVRIHRTKDKLKKLLEPIQQ